MTDKQLTKPTFKILDSYIARDLNNYFSQVKSGYREKNNSFTYYRQLVDGLLQMKSVELAPLYELFSRSVKNKRIIGLRHDIDADPIAALRCARYLAQKGICGSFYLLHTAAYYGDFYKNCFIRHPQIVEWIMGFIVAGCEIGLHNDSLGLYKNHETDGAQSLIQELQWLRSLGAVIRGTVAHNSGPVYKAENYEIFNGRQLWQRSVKSKSGREIPLGCVDEKDLQLDYEGTFAEPRLDTEDSQKMSFFKHSHSDVCCAKWMKAYLLENPCCQWKTDYQFWLIGTNSWVVAGKHLDHTLFEWQIGLDKVLKIITDLPLESRSVIVLHPVYVSS